MHQEEIWDVGAAQHYDTPGTGMFAPEVLDPTVDRLADLAGGGPALELAIGTGRGSPYPSPSEECPSAASSCHLR